MVKAELVSGWHRWLLIGAYIPPSETNAATIDQISEVLHKFRDCKFKSTVLLGDSNTNIDRPRNIRQVETTALISTSGFFDVGDKF